MEALWNVVGSVGLLMSLIWLVTAAMRLSKAITLTRGAAGSLDEMTEKLLNELERMDDNHAAVKREIAKQEEGRNRGREALARLESDLSPEAMAQRVRYYVLSDRRSQNDQPWVTPVSNHLARSRPWHPWYIESWSRPRLYVSWAPNGDMARRMAESKFATNAGFALGPTTALPEAQAKSAGG